MAIPEKLYHGTSYSNWHHIRDYGGLRSRGFKENEEGGNWKDIPSNPYAVYLTTCYAPYFANAASEDNEPWVILEINTTGLEQHLFHPDEDTLEQASRGHDVDFMPISVVTSDMKTRTLWFRDNIELFQHLSETSLSLMGTVGYYGPVMMNSITRFSTVDPKKYPVLCSMIDPMITIMNFSIMGDVYNAITRAMLGYRVPVEDLFIMGHSKLYEMAAPDTMKKLRKELQSICLHEIRQ